MATIAAAAANKTHSLHTSTISGLSNNTQYVLRVTTPYGSIANVPFTTDGSGNASVTYMPPPNGTATYAVYTAAVSTLVAGPVTVTCPGE